MTRKPRITQKQIDALFTAEEQSAIKSTGQRVWDEIGGDCLEAVGEGSRSATMSRAAVIEVVMDADRLFEHIRHDRRYTPEFKAKMTYDNARIIEAVLKQTFTYGRYGY